MEAGVSVAGIEYRLRRGMLELDALLRRFYHAQFSSLTLEQQQSFALLLELEDPTLYRLLIGAQTHAQNNLQELITRIRSHSCTSKD